MQPKVRKATSQLTPRQLQLLRTIRCFQESQCYSPTIGELACELGISRSTTFEHIAELRRKGLLTACAGRARSLRLTSKAQRLLSVLTDQSLGSYHRPPTGIPLAGRVAAGAPIEAIEDKDYLSLASYFGNDDRLFCLEVAGDSMVGDGIHNGDYVICRRSSLADNGQLVVAVLGNGDATLKRFYKEEKCVRLQPANDDYAPIYSDDCRIEAVVVGLVRKL